MYHFLTNVQKPLIDLTPPEVDNTLAELAEKLEKLTGLLILLIQGENLETRQ